MRSRIVILEHTDPSETVPSGIDSVIRDIVKFGNGRQIVVFGVSPDPGDVGHWKTRYVGNGKYRFYPVASFDRASPRRGVPHSARFALGLIRHRRTVRGALLGSLVHTHRLETGAVALLLGAKHLFQFIHNQRSTLTGVNSESVWSRFGVIYATLERCVLGRAVSGVIFSRSESHRLANAGVAVVPAQTWYDDGIFFPPKDVSAKLKSQDRAEVLWLGRLESQKDPLLAISVAKELQALGVGFDLRIAGSGQLAGEVQAKIDGLSLQDEVRLLGALSQGDVAESLRRARAVLMTSHFEGSPATIVEALACGSRVTATAGSDPDGLLSDGVNGASIDSREPRRIAEALARELSHGLGAPKPPRARAATVAVERLLAALERQC